MHSPRQTQKKYHSNAALLAVGGTPNPVRHLFGGTDPQDTNRDFAIVTTRTVKSYVPPTTSWGYGQSDPNGISGVRRSDGTITHRPALCLATLQKRADRKDMTVAEYCEWANLPYSEDYTV